MFERERLADHATHRKAYPVRFGHRAPFERGGDVRGHFLERVGAPGRGTLAMATQVEGEHAKGGREDRNELLPHPVVATDGVREDDDLAAPAGIDAMQVDRLHRLRLRAFFRGARAGASSAITSRASRKAVLAAGMPQ